MSVNVGSVYCEDSPVHRGLDQRIHDHELGLQHGRASLNRGQGGQRTAYLDVRLLQQRLLELYGSFHVHQQSLGLRRRRGHEGPTVRSGVSTRLEARECRW